MSIDGSKNVICIALTQGHSRNPWLSIVQSLMKEWWHAAAPAPASPAPPCAKVARSSVLYVVAYVSIGKNGKKGILGLDVSTMTRTELQQICCSSKLPLLPAPHLKERSDERSAGQRLGKALRYSLFVWAVGRVSTVSMVARITIVI